MSTRSLPNSIQGFVRRLGLSWDVVCHVLPTADVWPSVHPDAANHCHVLTVHPDFYERAEEHDVRGAWFHTLGHLVLGETRDPVFCDNEHQTKMLTHSRSWPIEAVTGVWAFDELCERLPLELLMESVIPRMFGDLVREYPALLRPQESREQRLGFHTSLAKCYGICVRADRIIGLQNTFAPTAAAVFRTQGLHASQDCDQRALGSFFRDLQPLAAGHARACEQLAEEVEALRVLLELPFRFVLVHEPERCWWQVISESK